MSLYGQRVSTCNFMTTFIIDLGLSRSLICAVCSMQVYLQPLNCTVCEEVELPFFLWQTFSPRASPCEICLGLCLLCHLQAGIVCAASNCPDKEVHTGNGLAVSPRQLSHTLWTCLGLVKTNPQCVSMSIWCCKRVKTRCKNTSFMFQTNCICMYYI